MTDGEGALLDRRLLFVTGKGGVGKTSVAAALAELAATIVLYFGEWSTMPIQIFQQIDSGEFGTASAYASVLIAAIFLPLFIAIKFFKVDVFAAK